ncbi:hypothetical protein [Emticicia oligotrophica]|uniref:hypothetical protein n=1 Tax=Emticicia oligotrophica TaxID=312279 RepID=UPI00273C60A2|nr:hypothetical protein [Emticicia oligotrophica]
MKRKFIEKVIADFGDDYQPIRKNDFESINLSALITAILKKNRGGIPEQKLKDYLVSEQTLRRIFEERDKDTTFQQATRNFLSLYIGFQNYQDFIDNANFEENLPQKNFNWPLISIIVGFGVLFLMLGFIWSKKTLVEAAKGKITNVTLESDKAPITVKFDYQLKNIEDVEKVYLDYSANSRSIDTTLLSPQKNTASVCFIHPTIRTVKLMADNRKLDSIKVIIPSEGWVAGYEEIFYLNSTQWKKNGVAHIQKEDLIEEVRNKSTYYSFLKKVSNFNGSPSTDEISFEAKVKNPSSEGGIVCNDISFELIGEDDKIQLNLTKKGCSHYSYIHYPNKKIKGATHDLQKLGINLDEFVDVKIVTHQMKLEIFIDNELVYQTNYDERLGKLNAIYIGFRGLGTIDYIKLSNPITNKLLEVENF